MYKKFLKKPLVQSKIIYQFVKDVFPIVDHELSFWHDYAQQIPNPILSEQALASIEKKAFHAQGGCIYSLYYYQTNPDVIKFIVALQTISDYLDNLCDRVDIESEISFLQLHEAIIDALSPNTSFSDYYKFYPYKEDSGYLSSLVNVCKSYIQKLPSYSLVQPQVFTLGKLYSEMQSYKHVARTRREKIMHNWASPYLTRYPYISTWEFSAAAGSTLAIFLLCTIAQDTNLTTKEVMKIIDAYFPWICGLHILLDYFIDEKEDHHTGDLNFISYYNNQNKKQERLILFLKQSLDKIPHLSNQLFHLTVIEGLLAMYLSDPKINFTDEKIIRKELLQHASFTTNTLYTACKLLRIKNIIH